MHGVIRLVVKENYMNVANISLIHERIDFMIMIALFMILRPRKELLNFDLLI